MSEVAAVYKALKTRLTGDAAWTAVYAERAAPDAARPYVMTIMSGGGRERVRLSADNANVVVTIKCVANTMAAALTGQAALTTLLDDRGAQEGGGFGTVDGWQMLTVTEETAVLLVEPYQSVDEVYHAGHQYRFVLERED